MDGVLGIVGIEGNCVIGQGVKGTAFVEELAEFLRIAGKRAVVLIGDAFLNQREGHIQPDSDTGVFEAFAIAGPGECSTAKRSDRGAATISFFDDGVEGVGFDLAKGGLALSFEDTGDGLLLLVFNGLIEVEEAPADFVSEFSADGGFATAHKTDEIDSGGSL